MRTVTLAAVMAVLLAVPASADWVKLEDFEGLDNIDHWGGAWYADSGETTTSGVVADPDNPGNNVLFIDDPSDTAAADANHNRYLDLGDEDIADGATGTLFGRMRTKGILFDADGHFGVTDVAAPAAWGDFSAYMSTQGGVQGWRVHDGGYKPTDQVPDNQTWVNFWVVVDNPNNVYHVYYTTTYGEDAELLSDNMTHDDTDDTFTFRHGAGANAMQTLLVRAGAKNEVGWYLDDLYIDSSSRNLSNPVGAIPEPGTLMLLSTAALGLIGYVRRERRN